MKPKNFAISNLLKQQAMLQGVLGTMQKVPAWMEFEQIKAEISGMPVVQLKQELDQMQHLRSYFDEALSIHRQVEAIYGPLKDITKEMTSLTIEWAAALQASEALRSIPQVNFIEFEKIATIIQDYFPSEKSDFSDMSAKELQNYCAEGKITPDTVAEAVEMICAEASEEKLTIPDRIDKVKRTNWFFALAIVWMILSFLGKPAIDHLKGDALEALGVTQFWEQSGIYEWLDELFNVPSKNGAVSEDEAKASLDVHSGNISKEKRDDLLAKISAIRGYIAAAPQDENTGNLLTYLSDLEKDVNGKKYGLVFEEHREAIDEVLEDYTPVLTEEPELLIEKDGEMNFLLEGDNLAALRLLEKTHRGRIDLIYIDPPYNTGNKDFTYDDSIVASDDGYRHSKWISFIKRRLSIATKLLSQNGAIVISIGYQEVNNLMLLCQELFENKQIMCVTVQTSGGKPNGCFNVSHEYIVFIVPPNFQSNPVEEAMNSYGTPYHGMNLATFNQAQRPNQAYPIFINPEGVLTGIGKSISERIADGSYVGDPADFVFDYQEAPEGTVAVWPITDKGEPCVWRLIPNRLKSDWSKGYIRILPQRKKNNPNKFTVQYLSAGVIKKIESKELESCRASDNPNIPTINVKAYKTAGSSIPTIWIDKRNYTTNGSNEIKGILGEKSFSYPKPLALIKSILKRITQRESLVLDFFAGSGTTGHAVMELNAEDGGHRKFILCTNNENDICRNVTYERIKRVIEREGYAASLKYYRIDYVPINEQLYYEYADELLRHVRELVELENGVNFIENSEIAIVLTDEELADFIARPEAFSKCHTLYLGHDILPTGEQDAAIKERGVRVNIIPDYYYRELEG